MNSASIMESENGFRVNGHIHFNNVMALRHAGENWMTQYAREKKQCVIDLSGVIEMDSSIFSLLLCWMRFALQQKLSFAVQHESTSLQRMQTLFGLTALWTN